MWYVLGRMESPPVLSAPAVPKGSDRIWSMFSHLSVFLGVPFLLPLVVYLAMRHESEYVARNAREALNFHITVLIYGLCCVPLFFVLIGIPIFFALIIASLVLAIIATIKASDNQCYHYPLTIRLIN
jgi:uncharacterized Tic20 family protein